VLGERTYQGKRCRKCGGTERYTKGCGCVNCLRSYAIEARQLYKANLGEQKTDTLPERACVGSVFGVPASADDDLDFLNSGDEASTAEPETSIDDLDLGLDSDLHTDDTDATLRPTHSNPLENQHDTLTHSNSLSGEEIDQEYILTEKEDDPSVPVCRDEKPEADPEPICPDCGCPCEADHEPIGGWLRRVSPWRCTICEWEDAEPAPEF
jgi:hypothetical protein